MNLMVFFVFCFFFLEVSIAQSWKKIENFPGVERDDGASFVIKGKAYAGSGVVPFTPLRDFYAFDFKTESWDSIASLPIYEGRQYSAAFASEGYGFVFGGISNVFLNDLWAYDPIANQWSKKTSLPAAGRGGAAAICIDSFAYIFGGKTQTKAAIAEVWAYNLYTDHWKRKADMPFGPRWRSAATLYNGKAYLIFGLDDTLRYCPEIYEYDPVNDQWTLFSSFPEGGRNYVKAHTINNGLITIAGQDSVGKFLNECWKLNYLTKVWEEVTALPSLGRRGGISFTDSTSIYYTTGLTDSGRRFVETWKFENPTSLAENKLQNQLKIYPNPAHQNLNVSSALPIQRVVIYNLNAQIIIELKPFKTDLEIEVSDFPPGIYIAQIYSDFVQSTVKFTTY